MISTWPEIQKTAQYFTDTLLVHSETSVSNGCTYYSSKSKTDLSSNQANFPRTFRARPRQIPLSDEQREKFKKEFERQLWYKLLTKDNWRMDQPEYGRGYRCISLRLLHKRAQLFDRFEKIDNKTTVSKKKSEIFNLMTDHKLEMDTTCNRLENRNNKGWDNTDKYDKHETLNSGTHGNSSSKLDSSHDDFENSKHDFSVGSSLVSSRSNSFGLIDPNNLPKLQIHDLGTRVYIDPIIITTFINAIDRNISKLDKSRQYVEILRYIDETVIDGKHEMMLWLDPGLVEIQHVWLEQRDMHTGNPNSSREEVTKMKNEVIYRSKGNTHGNNSGVVNHIVNSSVNSSYTHSSYGAKFLKQNSQTSSNDQDRNSNTTHFNKNCKLKFTEQVRNAPDELLRKCSS
jgi:hypothetical protein